jgi:hypothetical protein
MRTNASQQGCGRRLCALGAGISSWTSLHLSRYFARKTGKAAVDHISVVFAMIEDITSRALYFGNEIPLGAAMIALRDLVRAQETRLWKKTFITAPLGPLLLDDQKGIVLPCSIVTICPVAFIQTSPCRRHGRTAGCPTAPAQISACGTTAPSSSTVLASAQDSRVHKTQDRLMEFRDSRSENPVALDGLKELVRREASSLTASIEPFE